MSDSTLNHLGPEVHQFIARLYQSSTMRYALNHSQMEAWVALEGLEHFSQRGWSSWETMGFISGQAVRPKKGTSQSIMAWIEPCAGHDGPIDRRTGSA